MRKITSLLLIMAMVISLLAGCAKKEEATETVTDTAVATTETTTTTDEATTDTATAEVVKPSGEIVVLTHRTDLVDTVFVEYAKKFNEIYPDIKVNFQSATDYEGDTKIRMNSDDYGDVLNIPNGITAAELQNFFEPLGTVDELSANYNLVTEKAYEGTVYGLATTINVAGIVYNKEVWAAAGITKLPSTPEEFLADLQLIKEKTEAIPLYTNYAAGWPLTQWEDHRVSISGDAEFVNSLAHTDTPFAEGTPEYVIYKLMYDIAKNGLIEEDPLTTDWEASKYDIANGKIATMVLGSWAITQMQEKAVELGFDKNIIGYMPFPSNKDGVVYASSGGDYKIAVSKNSKNKEAAKAWVDWFINESNFAFDQGGISALKSIPYPETLKAFSDMGVVLVASNPAPAGEEGLVDLIDNTSEVGLWQPMFKQRLIDSALGASSESFEDIMTELNTKWADARKELGVN